ncbi:MAG: tRNA uridine-5-carboxymethylaminomethyl(34) synthesis GTPase MnmE, partial [Alphaproteobacteria bacterium]
LVYDAAAGPLPAALAAMADARSWVLANKIDLAGPCPPPDHWAVSARTGAGIDIFLAALCERLAAEFTPPAAPALTRVRHRQALEEALAALHRADAMLARDMVLAAEDLRLAARALGRITGRVDVEDVLDRIFADFCIGK